MEKANTPAERSPFYISLALFKICSLIDIPRSWVITMPSFCCLQIGERPMRNTGNDASNNESKTSSIGSKISASKLFYGDNLSILRDYIPSESIDLIYLHPPFNSNR